MGSPKVRKAHEFLWIDSCPLSYAGLATELGSSGVTVNCIAPGYFLTELTDPLARDEQFNNMVVARTPLRRWGKPEELQGPLVFLASRAGAYVNGHLLVVDGGMTVAL